VEDLEHFTRKKWEKIWKNGKNGKIAGVLDDFRDVPPLFKTIPWDFIGKRAILSNMWRWFQLQKIDDLVGERLQK
jgi:hypothetical protein